MKAQKSRQWKLLPKRQRPNLELALGDYSINKKSAKKMGPEMTRMTLEKGDLQLRILKNPLKTFVENRERIKVLFSVKQRHTFLSQAIKKRILSNVIASNLTQREELLLKETIGFLDKLGEAQLLSILNNHQTRPTKEFVQYLADNKSRLISLRQAELNLESREIKKNSSSD